MVIWDFQTNPATSCPFGIKTRDAKTPHRGSCQHRQQRRPPNGFSTGPVVEIERLTASPNLEICYFWFRQIHWLDLNIPLHLHHKQCPGLQTFKAPDTEVASYLSTCHWVVSGSTENHALHSNMGNWPRKSTKSRKGPDHGWVNITTLYHMNLPTNNWNWFYKFA